MSLSWFLCGSSKSIQVELEFGDVGNLKDYTQPLFFNLLDNNKTKNFCLSFGNFLEANGILKNSEFSEKRSVRYQKCPLY